MREVLYIILVEFGIYTKLFRLIQICLNVAYNRDRICKYKSRNFSIRNGLKQGYALSPLLFNFNVKYAIKKA
jgi:hypothetical protein